MKIPIMPDVWIEETDIDFQAVPSQGPGGQHVNKVSTRVVLRLNLHTVQGIPPEIRSRWIEKLGRRLTAEGELIVTSQETRSQKTNRDHAMERLIETLRGALVEKRVRRATKIPLGIRRERLESKRRVSGRKALRRSISPRTLSED